jgi:hypothetical protein
LQRTAGPYSWVNHVVSTMSRRVRFASDTGRIAASQRTGPGAINSSAAIKGYGGPHPRRDFLSVGVDAGVGPGESSKFKIAKLLFPQTAGLRRTRTLASGAIYGRPR